MNILMYCQYNYGIGHMTRTLVIANELAKDHQVTLICGGKPSGDALSNNENLLHLYHIKKDSLEWGLPLANTNRAKSNGIEDRQHYIKTIVDLIQPDILWIESFPFARRVSRSEILTSIAYTRKKHPKCKIYSSARDVLLKYGGDPEYRSRISLDLNCYFDAVFVHSDPTKIPFELTFGPLTQIECPIIYTGFVCRRAPKHIQRAIWSSNSDIIASYGGSDAGREITLKTIECHQEFYSQKPLHIFLSPRCNEFADNLKIQISNKQNITLHPFSWDYINHLASTSLSISMGGYNSVIEAIAHQTPSIMVPYDGNMEQQIRLEQLKDEGPIAIINSTDLNAHSLHKHMESLATRPIPSKLPNIDMNGAYFIRKYFYV